MITNAREARQHPGLDQIGGQLVHACALRGHGLVVVVVVVRLVVEQHVDLEVRHADTRTAGARARQHGVHERREPRDAVHLVLHRQPLRAEHERPNAREGFFEDGANQIV